MGSGMIVATLLIPSVIILKNLPFFVLLYLGVLLYIPAVLQIWIQQKTYKILARFSLGIAVIFLCYAGLWLTPNSTVGWILKLGFITIFILFGI
jgi:hypothetical protein